MDLVNLFKDKNTKPKQKTELLANALLGGDISTESVLTFATIAKDTEKASCIEAFEFVTKQKPDFAKQDLLNFAVENLKSKAPRVKWESAKVIGNVASQFKSKLEPAIAELLKTTEDKGTVVRWSAAYALAEILKLKTKHQTDLLKAVETILNREEKNSIKKIYQSALKACK